MILPITIFLIAITTAFGMLAFRAWELRTGRVETGTFEEHTLPSFSFRQFERTMLYLAKHVIQWIVLFVVKHWFIFITKGKKWISEKWPKIHAYFEPKISDSPTPTKLSFVKRAVLESKAKIKHIKEKVKEEHE